MLQTLRDKSTGWIATVILGLLIVPFAFFGMEQYLFQRNVTFVAKVEAPPVWWPSAPAWWPVTMLWQREEVSAAQFRSAFDQARQQQRSEQAERFDAIAFESADNKRQILDELVDRKILELIAERAGVAASDAQVRDAIQAIPAFQVDGKFNPQRYQLALGSQIPAQSPRQFEQTVRDSLQVALIPTQVTKSAFVTKSQMDRMLKLLGEQRDVSFAILPLPTTDARPVTPAEIQAWYRSHPNDYRAPESVTIEYVDIDAQSLPAAAAADDAALRARYNQEKTRFIEPEQRLASHILISVDAKADAATRKAAEDKAKSLTAQAKQAGADFAALARVNSNDTGSQASGGDLGWVEKGAMVAPFEQALFAMQAGEIRGPVKTEFGWHVLKLREIKAGKQVPFEQAREDLAREQGVADRERQFNEITGKLVDQVYQNPSSLSAAASAVKLPVQKLGPFARGAGTGIATNAAVQRAAFSEALIEDGTVSDPIEIAPNHSVLIRVIEHTSERAQPLANVRTRIVAAIRADRASKALTASADSMLAALQKGGTLQALASQRGINVVDVPNVQRGMPVPDETAAQSYFTVAPPIAGRASPGKAILADGRVVVFAVTKVTPGDVKAVPEVQRQTLQDQLEQLAGSEDAAAMVKGLRRRLTITVAEERL